MNHDEAIRLKAAEKYLLGELSAELRDQYEDHYFGCAACSQDVRTGAIFIDNARDVLGSGSVAAAELGAKQRPAGSGGWWTALLRPAFAVPALALLLLVAGYQNAVTIPHLRTALSQSEVAQTLPSFSLISENSRGGAPLAISVPAGKPFSFFVDIPPKGSYASYACEFQTESGAPELSLNISAEEAKRTVQLLIPAGRLASGKHVLVVRGLDSQGKPDADKIGVANYPFSLDYTK
jgi:Putative zinc-finger